MKRCFRCQVVKPLSDFYAHAAMKDGRVGVMDPFSEAMIEGGFTIRDFGYEGDADA